MRVERTGGLTEQPAIPIGIFFLEQHRMFVVHAANGTPARLIDVPFLSDSRDLANPAGAQDVSDGKWIRLAAVLRAHLHHLLRLLHSIPCQFRFFQNVGKRLLDIAVFSRLNHFHAKLGVLMVAGCNHDAIDIGAGQHLLRVLVRADLCAEHLLHLGRAPITSQRPDVANRDHFHWRLLVRHPHHVDMPCAPSTAAKLGEPDAVIRANNPTVRASGH